RRICRPGCGRDEAASRACDRPASTHRHRPISTHPECRKSPALPFFDRRPAQDQVRDPPGLSLGPAPGIIAIRIGSSGGAALLLIVDFLEIGDNDLVPARPAGTAARLARSRPTVRPWAALPTAFAAARLLGAVHRL